MMINTSGKSINFTDWTKSTGKQLGAFKLKVGDEKFNQAKQEYGELLKQKRKAT